MMTTKLLGGASLRLLIHITLVSIGYTSSSSFVVLHPRRVRNVNSAATCSFLGRRSSQGRQRNRECSRGKKQELSGFFFDFFKKDEGKDSNPSSMVVNFVENWNEGNLNGALANVAQDFRLDFASFFYDPSVRLDSLENRLRLIRNGNASFSDQQRHRKVVIDKFISSKDKLSVGLKFHIEEGVANNNLSKRGSAFFKINEKGLIQDGFWLEEQDTRFKFGEKGLKLLRAATSIMERTRINPAAKDTLDSFRHSSSSSQANNNENGKQQQQQQKQQAVSSSSVIQFFDAWNRRDIPAAAQILDENVTYDDTAFPQPFVGKEAVKKHLLLCAESFPPTFLFRVEDVIDVGRSACVKWHVENNKKEEDDDNEIYYNSYSPLRSGNQLPFTRGCSFYELDQKTGKIVDVIDFVEPSVLKQGNVMELIYQSTLLRQFFEEPARLVPFIVWVAYILIVFFSDGILPGANALALEVRTWEEVRDLSVNFFFVSPILGLPFSPLVHPMLEGVFNLLLAWAAMFAGFLSDDRQDKQNIFPMLPAVVGMQFLTSAFLLPYLALRSNEKRSNVSIQDLSPIARVFESPFLGIGMGVIGVLSTGWFFWGRQSDFGYEFIGRWNSFQELLAVDRVGSSFLVDLVVFGLFQFWLIDDDMKRRGQLGASEFSNLVWIAKFVPFFGMATYLALRPPLNKEVSM